METWTNPAEVAGAAQEFRYAAKVLVLSADLRLMRCFQSQRNSVYLNLLASLQSSKLAYPLRCSRKRD